MAERISQRPRTFQKAFIEARQISKTPKATGNLENYGGFFIPPKGPNVYIGNTPSVLWGLIEIYQLRKESRKKLI